MIKGVRYLLQRNREREFIRRSGINEQDFFLASFPKSGNTWLRYILARALYPEVLIDQSNLLEYFPTVYKSSPEDVIKLRSPRFIKTHSTFFSLYPKTIYVVRDYRAVVFSAWHHAKNKVNYKGSLADFVDTKMMNAFGPWHWHVSEALNYKKAHSGKMLFLEYETMLNDSVRSVKEILEFAGIDPIISVEEIVVGTKFQKLQSLEKNGGQNPEQLFFRSGMNEDWKNHITGSIESRLLDASSREIMKRCGYSV